MMERENSRYYHSQHARVLMKKLLDESEYNISTFGKAMGFADGSPVSKFISGKVNWSYRNICNAARLLGVASLVFMDDIGDTIIKPRNSFTLLDSHIEILMQSKDFRHGIVKQTFNSERFFLQSTIEALCDNNCFFTFHLIKGEMFINGEKKKYYTIYDDPKVKIFFERQTEVMINISNLNKELYLYFEKYLIKPNKT